MALTEIKKIENFDEMKKSIEEYEANGVMDRNVFKNVRYADIRIEITDSFMASDFIMSIMYGNPVGKELLGFKIHEINRFDESAEIKES